MQLSVWEKPVDLRHRGDLNRIIEDPPHKRKLEASAGRRAGQPARTRLSVGPCVPRASQGSMFLLLWLEIGY